MSIGHQDDEEADQFLDNLLAVVPQVLNLPYQSAQKLNRAMVRNGFLPPPPSGNNLRDSALDDEYSAGEYSAGGDEQLRTRRSKKKVLICIVLYAPSH